MDYILSKVFFQLWLSVLSVRVRNGEEENGSAPYCGNSQR